MKWYSLVALLVSMVVTAWSGNAYAKTDNNTCLLYKGSGGEATFPGWPLRKEVIMPLRASATIWLNAGCGKPRVKTSGQTSVRFTVEKEDLSLSTNVSVGYRVYFWTTNSADIGQTEVVRVYSGSKAWKIRIHVVADAGTAARLAKKALKKADTAKAEADKATRDAAEAKNTANEAHANSGGTGGKRDVELVLSPMISLESPGHEGYGMALGVNAILGKFASKGMVQLGLSGRMSWHYYEQEVIGLAQNSDVMAHEFDGLAMFLFRLRPVSWFAAEASTGFGVRIFTHDDAVTLQNADYLIRGVEGRVAYHPLWAANLGVKFWPHEVVSLGIQWGTTVSMTRQVQNPNAEGGSPDKSNVWNHFVMINLGFNL